MLWEVRWWDTNHAGIQAWALSLLHNEVLCFYLAFLLSSPGYDLGVRVEGLASEFRCPVGFLEHSILAEPFVAMIRLYSSKIRKASTLGVESRFFISSSESNPLLYTWKMMHLN